MNAEQQRELIRRYGRNLPSPLAEAARNAVNYQSAADRCFAYAKKIRNSASAEEVEDAERQGRFEQIEADAFRNRFFRENSAAFMKAINQQTAEFEAARRAVRNEMREATLAAIDACVTAGRPDAIGNAARAVSSGAMTVEQVRQSLANDQWAGAFASAHGGIRPS